MGKYLNANDDYTEVQKIPHATHVPCIHGSQNKVLSIRESVKFGSETSVYIGALSTFWIQKKSVYVIITYSNFRIS
jgi:hypothetical protein